MYVSSASGKTMMERLSMWPTYLYPQVPKEFFQIDHTVLLMRSDS